MIKAFQRKHHPLRKKMNDYVKTMEAHKYLMAKMDVACQNIISGMKLNPVLKTDAEKIENIIETQCRNFKIDASQSKVDLSIIKLFNALNSFMSQCSQKAQTSFLMKLYLRACKDTKKGGYGLQLDVPAASMTLEMLLNLSNTNKWLENAIIDSIEYDILRPSEEMKKNEKQNK